MNLLRKAWTILHAVFIKLYKLLGSFFMKKSSLSLNDKSIKTEGDDEFGFNNRIVKNIYSFLERDISPCIIAVTGPWGSGKTSVINLLKKKIEAKYTHIDFDPIIECKFSVLELLESFLLKLSLYVSGNGKKAVIKILKSLYTLVPNKIGFSTGVKLIGIETKVSTEINPQKIIDDLLEIWSEQKPHEYSKQIEELNKILNKTDEKIIVFIDEIDRLPANEIINFLVFSRVLEEFECVRCIVTFDYRQVLLKLTEHHAKFSDKNDSAGTIAANYLEKFFLVRYEVCNSLRGFPLTEYASKLLDKYNILSKDDVDSAVNIIEISKIALLLQTPRNVKRWVANVLQIDGILKTDPESRIVWLQLIAVFTKYPLWLTEFSNSIRKISSSQDYAKEIDIILGKCKDNDIDEIRTSIRKNFSNIKPNHLILFLVGIEDEAEINVFSDLDHNINQSLPKLLENIGDIPDQVIDDFIDVLSKYNTQDFPFTEPPDVNMLLRLWNKFIKINNIDLSFDRRFRLIILLLRYTTSKQETIAEISKVSLILGERYLIDLLELNGVKNKGGVYDILECNNKDELCQCLEVWINSVEKNLFLEEDNKATHLMSVCYRFLQWSNTIGGGSKKERAKNNLIRQIKIKFQESGSDDFKKNFIRLMNNRNFREDHLSALFNNDKELVDMLKKYAKQEGLDFSGHI